MRVVVITLVENHFLYHECFLVLGIPIRTLWVVGARFSICFRVGIFGCLYFWCSICNGAWGLLQFLLLSESSLYHLFGKMDFYDNLDDSRLLATLLCLKFLLLWLRRFSSAWTSLLQTSKLHVCDCCFNKLFFG